MKRSLIFLVSCLLIITACSETDSIDNQSSEKEQKHIQETSDLLAFFNTNAYNKDFKTFYSEVDNEGKVVSSKVYNVALSRLIYGLSYAASIDTVYLKKAQDAVNFQLDHIVQQNEQDTYFASYFDIETGNADSSLNLDIWQQAYGLCGLSELYRNFPEEKLLSKIHQLHRDFVNKFHDKSNGGFYGNYANDEGVSGSKSLQALLYPITSYMENLWSADVKNRDKYESYLKENIALAYKNGWNKELGWVNIKFDDNWNPCSHDSPTTPCFNVTPGHNFQFATLFLRAKNWTFLTEEERVKYKAFE